MSLRSRNKIQAGFSMSGMTDIVFLLLIFFMITSTLIAPNALKLLLPQSSHQTMANAITTVSITRNYEYYVETTAGRYRRFGTGFAGEIGRRNRTDNFSSCGPECSHGAGCQSNEYCKR
jgi:biopolymer transport protein ExbD